MFCIFRYLCATVYIQLFSFRAASACLINSVVSNIYKTRSVWVFVLTGFRSDGTSCPNRHAYIDGLWAFFFHWFTAICSPGQMLTAPSKQEIWANAHETSDSIGWSNFSAVDSWNMGRRLKSQKITKNPLFLDFKVVQGHRCWYFRKARQDCFLW